MVRLYVYSTSEHTIGAWLQYSDNSADHSILVFNTYNDMILFALNMGIGSIGIVTSRQALLPHSIRLHCEDIQTSIVLAQSKRKGMKRIITIYSTALQSPI